MSRMNALSTSVQVIFYLRNAYITGIFMHTVFSILPTGRTDMICFILSTVEVNRNIISEFTLLKKMS